MNDDDMDLSRAVARAGRNIRAAEAGRGIEAAAAAFVFMWTALVVSHYILDISEAARFALRDAVMLAAITIAAALAGPAAVRRIRPGYAAQMLERANPALGGRVFAAMSMAADAPAAAAALVRRQAAEALGTLGSRLRMPSATSWRLHGVMLAALAGHLLAMLALWNGFFASFLQCAFPGGPYENHTTPRFASVEPGDVELRSGSPIAIRARVTPAAAASGVVIIMEGREEPMTPEGTGRWSFRRMSVDRGFTYRLAAKTDGEPLETERFRVTVRPYPVLARLAVKYEYPAYTGFARRTEAGGDVRALSGARVTIEAEVNAATLSVRMESMELGAAEFERGADGSFRRTFVLDRGGQYALRLTGAREEVATESYRVDAESDRPPDLAVFIDEPPPGADVKAGLPATLRASDDLGLVRLTLEIKDPAGKVHAFDAPLAGGEKEVVRRFKAPGSAFEAGEGEYRYRLIGEDIRAPKPNQAATEEKTLRIRPRKDEQKSPLAGRSLSDKGPGNGSAAPPSAGGKQPPPPGGRTLQTLEDEGDPGSGSNQSSNNGQSKTDPYRRPQGIDGGGPAAPPDGGAKQTGPDPAERGNDGGGKQTSDKGGNAGTKNGEGSKGGKGEEKPTGPGNGAGEKAGDGGSGDGKGGGSGGGAATPGGGREKRNPFKADPNATGDLPPEKERVIENLANAIQFSAEEIDALRRSQSAARVGFGGTAPKEERRGAAGAEGTVEGRAKPFLPGTPEKVSTRERSPMASDAPPVFTPQYEFMAKAYLRALAGKKD
jgi:hypothetical protein